MIQHLFNHRKQHIGDAHFIKHNGTVEITYNNKIHYADVTIDFEEFESYLERMDLQTAEGEQIGLF